MLPAGTACGASAKVSVVELLDALEESFSFVVVDLPPTDALGYRVALARNLDAVLLVLPNDHIEVLTARAAMKQLWRLGINVRGTVLNEVRLAMSSNVNGPTN